MLNGYTDSGYWYQVGIAWHWLTFSNEGYTADFSFFAQVYHDNSNVRLLGLLSPLKIHGGDLVALRLNISHDSNTVTMSVYDWSTGAGNQTSPSAYGATQFVGDLGNTGHPTSLLVEAYGRDLVCALRSVTLTSTTAHPVMGIRIDEWNFTGIAVENRFNGNPTWSYPVNGKAPTGDTNACLTHLSTTACVATH